MSNSIAPVSLSLRPIYRKVGKMGTQLGTLLVYHVVYLDKEELFFGLGGVPSNVPIGGFQWWFLSGALLGTQLMHQVVHRSMMDRLFLCSARLGTRLVH